MGLCLVMAVKLTEVAITTLLQILFIFILLCCVTIIGIHTELDYNGKLVYLVMCIPFVLNVKSGLQETCWLQMLIINPLSATARISVSSLIADSVDFTSSIFSWFWLVSERDIYKLGSVAKVLILSTEWSVERKEKKKRWVCSCTDDT